MGIFGENRSRTSLKEISEIRQEAPALADIIMSGIENSTKRGNEIFILLNGIANRQQCSVLAELERLGVIEDIRADGSVAPGPNLDAYRQR